MESKKSVGALSVLPKFMTLNEKLRLELIDIQQDLRLSQHIPHFKKSVMRCTQILYDTQELFQDQSETYAIIKRTFDCLSVAFAKIFQTVEKISAQNNQLQLLKQHKGTQDAEQCKVECEMVETDIKKGLGGVSIGNNIRRGLDQQTLAPRKESPYSQFQRVQTLRKSMLQEREQPELCLKLTSEEMEHFKTSETTISTTSFLNRIGAHLNSIKQKTDDRREESFQEHLTNVLAQFENCQKQTTAFINKQSVDLPLFSVATEVDLRLIVDETQKERSRWKQQASSRVATLIDQSRAKIVGVMADMQKHIDRLQKDAKTISAKPDNSLIKPKLFCNKEIQTVEAQTNHWVIQDYHNKTVLLDEQNKRVAQLQELLYNSRYQLDNTKFESSRIKEYSALYKAQVETLKTRFNELEEQMTLLSSENNEFKQQRDDITANTLQRVVEECADDYSTEMKIAIKTSVQKILGKMGMIKDEKTQIAEPQQGAANVPLLSKRISKSSRISIRAVDNHSAVRRSLLEEFAEVRRLHQSVVSSVEEHLQHLHKVCEEEETNSLRKRESMTDSMASVIEEESEDEDEKEGYLKTLSSLQRNPNLRKNMETQAARLFSTLLKRDTPQNKKNILSKQHMLPAKRSSMSPALLNQKPAVSMVERRSVKESLFRTNNLDRQSFVSDEENVQQTNEKPRKPCTQTVSTNTDSEPTVQKKDRSVQTGDQATNANSNISGNLRDGQILPLSQSMQRIDTQEVTDNDKHLQRNTTGQRILSPSVLERGYRLTGHRQSLKKLQENDPLQVRTGINNTPNVTFESKRKSIDGVHGRDKPKESMESMENKISNVKDRQSNMLSAGESKLRSRRIDSKKKSIQMTVSVAKDTRMIPRRESYEKIGGVKMERAKSTKKLDEVDQTTERLLELGLVGERASEEVRQELELLTHVQNAGLLEVPKKINRETLTDLMRNVRQVHKEKCGKDVCKHLARFVSRINQLASRANTGKRKTFGVKLHNIREIQTATPQDADHSDTVWARQRQLFLR